MVTTIELGTKKNPIKRVSTSLKSEIEQNSPAFKDKRN